MIWTLKKRMYRVQHGVMKVVADVFPFPVPALLTGSGSVRQLAENIRIRGLKHVLVVTDKVLMNLKLPDGLLASLEENGVDYTVFDAVEHNPTIENVEPGRRLYKENRCDGIIGFGGGSPIDCAKIIGARISNPYLGVKRMKGMFRVFIPIPPFFAVPTTAGTGSETTIAAVITDADTHKKFAINDFKLIPKIAVLDPELMVGPTISSGSRTAILGMSLKSLMANFLWVSASVMNAAMVVSEPVPAVVGTAKNGGIGINTLNMPFILLRRGRDS